jgi:hypothetical protein
VAAVVTAGVVAGGLGFTTVKAVATESQVPTAQAVAPGKTPFLANPVDRLAPPGLQARSGAAGFAHPLDGRTGARSVRRAPTGDGVSAVGLPPAPTAAAASEGSAPSSVAGVSTAPVTDTANRVVSSVSGALPTAPTVSVPVATVTAPSAPTLPATTALPVTVPTVTVPTVTLPGP